MAEVSETTPTNPINPYGRSKLMSEQIIKDYAASKKISNLRFCAIFNVAGADEEGLIGQNYPTPRTLSRWPFKQPLASARAWVSLAMTTRQKDGTCVRDYIHVSDLADAHISALEYIRQNGSETFNVGYGRGFSVKEVIETAKK